jgi:CTP-dependent riboflavin kinase
MRKMDTSLFTAEIGEGIYFISSSHFSEQMIRRFATQQHPNPSNVSVKRAELPVPQGVEQSVAVEVARRIRERDEEETGFYVS